MQQIYMRTPMPKCDFSKVALQLYWNQTSAWVFSCKFAAYFQNTFSKEQLWVVASIFSLSRKVFSSREWLIELLIKGKYIAGLIVAGIDLSEDNFLTSNFSAFVVSFFTSPSCGWLSVNISGLCKYIRAYLWIIFFYFRFS